MRGVRTAVGIDPGTKMTGVAHVEIGGDVGGESRQRPLPFVCRETISINTDVGDVDERRDALRLAIQREIVPFVTRCAPDVIFIEDPQSRGMKIVKQLCTVRVMIEEALVAVTGQTPTIIHPATWRSHVSRLCGKAKGDDLKLVASRILGFDKKRQDEADAVWIAAAGLFRANGSKWNRTV